MKKKLEVGYHGPSWSNWGSIHDFGSLTLIFELFFGEDLIFQLEITMNPSNTVIKQKISKYHICELQNSEIIC